MPRHGQRRPARAQLARRAAPRSGVPRRLCADGRRGARPVRAHRPGPTICERAARMDRAPRRRLSRPAPAATSRSPADAGDVLVRPKNAQDGPTPAANGTLVAVLARLYALTGEDAYRARAEQLVEVFSGEARAQSGGPRRPAERLRRCSPSRCRSSSWAPPTIPRLAQLRSDRARRTRARSDRADRAARDRARRRTIRPPARRRSTAARPPMSASAASACRRSPRRTSWRSCCTPARLREPALTWSRSARRRRSGFRQTRSPLPSAHRSQGAKSSAAPVCAWRSPNPE